MENNPNSRLEAFCDGVFAIALTLLIIDVAIPADKIISSNTDLWLALKDLLPSIFSFLLSFIVIFITWVNHHNGLKLVNKTSTSFIYANGLLLLTVVFIPFPTALLGKYIFTPYAAPAVVLYNAMIVLQSVAWMLLTRAGIKHHLTKNEHAMFSARRNNRDARYAFVVYSLCAILAFWFPLTIAAITTLLWIYWLYLGFTIKSE